MGEQFQHRLPNQNIMKIFVAILLFISLVISGIVGHPRPDDFDLTEAEADPRKRVIPNRQYVAPLVEERLARRPLWAPLLVGKKRRRRGAPLVELTSELLARRPEEQYVSPVFMPY